MCAMVKIALQAWGSVFFDPPIFIQGFHDSEAKKYSPMRSHSIEFLGTQSCPIQVPHSPRFGVPLRPQAKSTGQRAFHFLQRWKPMKDADSMCSGKKGTRRDEVRGN